MEEAGGEGRRRGDELWWGRHATLQPEHTPGRWCTGCGKTRRRDGGKTPPCEPKGHLTIDSICVAIVAYLVGSGALEDVIRVVRRCQGCGADPE